jgi:lysozyme family protein
VSNFETIIPFTLANEGGYSNDYNDPGNWTGGAVNSGVLKGTKYGISAESFPDLDIINLTLSSAESIYKTKYWDVNNLDSIDAGLSYLIFDAAVNSGNIEGVSLIQQVVGVNQDGDLGPITQAAIASYIDTNTAFYIYYKYQTAHLQFLSNLSVWTLYSADYLKRNVYNMMVACSLNTNTKIPAPQLP